MARYMIHACKQRLWYVNDYLMPSMIAQGISECDIILWLDKDNRGNLASFVDSMEYCADDKSDGIWHIQDDVILCSDFKKRTEEHDTGLIAGFASYYDKDLCVIKECINAKIEKRAVNSNKISDVIWGEVVLSDMWLSFPCIRIPNRLAKDFIDWWLYSYVQLDLNVFEMCIKDNRHDDYLFRKFLRDTHPFMKAYNVKPNLVNHIDYLLGGSLVNDRKGEQVVSLFWDEPELVTDLKNCLEEYHCADK